MVQASDKGDGASAAGVYVLVASLQVPVRPRVHHSGEASEMVGTNKQGGSLAQAGQKVRR